MNAGLLLFSQMSTNTRLPRLVRIDPARYRRLLTERLCAIAGIDVPRQSTEPVPGPALPRRRFREEFPFLGERDCPPELKILAADKLTTYERYTRAHDRLFDCTTLEECYETAREVIDNFIENREIYAEMEYYREHHSILGKHRIFEHFRRLGELRRLSIVELCARQRRLRSAIWRVKDEIKKGTKPHLATERQQRLQSKEALLAEVDKLIEAYSVAR